MIVGEWIGVFFVAGMLGLLLIIYFLLPKGNALRHRPECPRCKQARLVARRVSFFSGKYKRRCLECGYFEILLYQFRHPIIKRGAEENRIHPLDRED